MEENLKEKEVVEIHDYPFVVSKHDFNRSMFGEGSSGEGGGDSSDGGEGSGNG